MSITLELPAEIEESLAEAWGGDDGELPRRILEAVAVEGYRQGALSRHEVGQLLDLGFYETETFLKEHDCYLDYTEADLEADRLAHEQVLGPPSVFQNQMQNKRQYEAKR